MSKSRIKTIIKVSILIGVILAVVLAVVHDHVNKPTGYYSTLKNGELYYVTRGDRLCKYSPEEGVEVVLGKGQQDDIVYGEESLYYSSRGNIYKMSYETGETQIMYDSLVNEHGRLTLEGMAGENLLVSETANKCQVMDCNSGAILSSITDEQLRDINVNADKQLKAAGKTFVQKVTEKDSFRYQLYYEDELILPDNKSYSSIETLDCGFLIQRGTGKFALYNAESETYTELPKAVSMTGCGDYIFYGAEDGKMYCYDINDNTQWQVYDGVNAYAMENDGNYLYVSHPMGGGTVKFFQIVYNEKKEPEKLELIKEF